MGELSSDHILPGRTHTILSQVPFRGTKPTVLLGALWIPWPSLVHCNEYTQHVNAIGVSYTFALVAALGTNLY